MAFAPLILQGNKQIGPGNAGALVNVDDQVIEFRIVAKRSTVEIPATFGKRKSYGAADDEYALEIRFLQDTDAAALSEVLWTALGDATGTINFSATMRDGAISATNPAWTGIAVVTGSDLGGKVNDVGITTVSFPLVDRPAKDVTP